SISERGMVDVEIVPGELTQVRMGKIVRDRYPELIAEDQETVRQHALAARNLTQKAKEMARGVESDDDDPKANLALIEGIRRYAMEVKELDIDLIDRINPFEDAYSILAKNMDEKTLRQVSAAIAKKNVKISREEAREL